MTGHARQHYQRDIGLWRQVDLCSDANHGSEDDDPTCMVRYGIESNYVKDFEEKALPTGIAPSSKFVEREVVNASVPLNQSWFPRHLDSKMHLDLYVRTVIMTRADVHEFVPLTFGRSNRSETPVLGQESWLRMCM